MNGFQHIEIDAIKGEFNEGCFDVIDQFGNRISLATNEDFEALRTILQLARKAMLERQEQQKNASTPLRLVG